MEDIIMSGSHIRLKIEPEKIYKVTSVNEKAQLVDATQKDKRRVPLKLSDVELATNEDIDKYEDEDTQIKY